MKLPEYKEQMLMNAISKLTELSIEYNYETNEYDIISLYDDEMDIDSATSLFNGLYKIIPLMKSVKDRLKNTNNINDVSEIVKHAYDRNGMNFIYDSLLSSVTDAVFPIIYFLFGVENGKRLPENKEHALQSAISDYTGHTINLKYNEEHKQYGVDLIPSKDMSIYDMVTYEEYMNFVHHMVMSINDDIYSTDVDIPDIKNYEGENYITTRKKLAKWFDEYDYKAIKEWILK